MGWKKALRPMVLCGPPRSGEALDTRHVPAVLVLPPSPARSDPLGAPEPSQLCRVSVHHWHPQQPILRPPREHVAHLLSGAGARRQQPFLFRRAQIASVCPPCRSSARRRRAWGSRDRSAAPKQC
eukprot:2669468-Rhodomonas_salina.5